MPAVWRGSDELMTAPGQRCVRTFDLALWLVTADAGGGRYGDVVVLAPVHVAQVRDCYCVFGNLETQLDVAN